MDSKNIKAADIKTVDTKAVFAENTKQTWKPGNMLYPLPTVMVSSAGTDGRTNIFTAAWAGTVCTNPPMVSVSIRPERYSYELIRESGEFVINLTSAALTRAMDYCGVRSGRTVDKWKECHLTPMACREVKAPQIGESPVSIECRVRQVLELGSHHMFIADVVAVNVNEALLNEKGALDLRKGDLVVYSHGLYQSLGEILGTFGYSVKKNSGESKATEKENAKRILSGNKQIETKSHGEKTRESNNTRIKSADSKKRVDKKKANSGRAKRGARHKS